jgi:hypothetical protein
MEDIMTAKKYFDANTVPIESGYVFTLLTE